MKKYCKLSITAVFFILLFNNSLCASRTLQNQVTGLKVHHRNGQTFLVWNGIENYGDVSNNDMVPGGILQKAFQQKYDALKQAEKEGKQIRYHVYRLDKPIDADTFGLAELVAKVEPLSIYYPYHLGMYWYQKKFADQVVPRLAVKAGQVLKDGRELYVQNVEQPGKYYYAVFAAVNNQVNRKITPQNVLKHSVFEEPGEPEPVLQRVRKIPKNKHFKYHKGPAEVRYYMRWVHDQYSNQPRCFEWSVAVPDTYRKSNPAALQLSLHHWGSGPDEGTFWYDIKPSTIRIATVNYPPQDWWYGYRKTYGISKSKKNDIVFNYTERRLSSFINWMQKHWKIDKNLIFVEGSSMGGSGAISFGMKNGQMFCYADSWVGIACWRHSKYFRNGESKKWGEIDELVNYNGLKFDDWMDLSWWLRQHPIAETPFLSFANGKNDGSIGWYQAVRAVSALWETKRPFVFLWGMGGHGQRAKFMFDPKQMAKNQSIPAFRNCSLDDKIGKGRKLKQPQKYKTRDGRLLEDWYDGDSTGQINAYLKWDIIKDQKDKYEISLFLSQEAPEDTCSVDMTPRRIQKFKLEKDQKFNWSNITVKDNQKIQAGVETADQWGLVTIKNLKVNKTGNRIKILLNDPHHVP